MSFSGKFVLFNTIGIQCYSAYQNLFSGNCPWKRPTEFNEINWSLFGTGISPSDIPNTTANNSSLLGIIRELAKTPEAIKKLFITKEFNERGYYELNLFIDNQWQIVIVDDCIPFSSNNFVPVGATNSSLWVILLVKAWAKIMEGYCILNDELTDYNPKDVFIVLTGLPVISLKHDTQFVNEIQQFTANNQYSFFCKSDQQSEYKGTSFQIEQITENQIKLKNMHNPTTNDSIILSISDYFNISKETFVFPKVQNFNPTHIFCEGEKEGVATEPTVHLLTVNKKSIFIFQLFLSKRLLNRRSYLSNSKNVFSFIVAEYNTKTKHFGKIYSKHDLVDNIECFLTLSPGNYVIWIHNPHTWVAPSRSHNLCILSDDKYTLKTHGKDIDFKIIHSIVRDCYSNKYGKANRRSKEQCIILNDDQSIEGINFLILHNVTVDSMINFHDLHFNISNCAMLPPYNKYSNAFPILIPNEIKSAITIKTDEGHSFKPTHGFKSGKILRPLLEFTREKVYKFDKLDSIKEEDSKIKYYNFMRGSDEEIENELSYVKKYFLDQQPPDIEELKATGQKFTDPLFPPDNRGLFGKKENIDSDEPSNFIDPINGPVVKKEYVGDQASTREHMEWKRVTETDYKMTLFGDGINTNQVNQGGLGDCYFVATLVNYARYPNLIKRLFKTKEVNDMGYYEVYLFIDGEWQIVILDDYFPYNHGFCYVHSETILWAMLLEKAYAKFNRAYTHICAGFAKDSHINLFTGMDKHMHISSKEHDQVSFVKEVQKYLKELTILGLGFSEESKVPEGIVRGHEHAVFDAEIVEDNVCLLKLRNPWGVNPYVGKFSKLKSKDQYINYNKEAKDGSFYVELYEIYSQIGGISVNFLYFNMMIKEFSFNESNYPKAPVLFNMILKESGMVYMSVDYMNWGPYRDFEAPVYPFGLFVVKIGGEDEFENAYGASSTSGTLSFGEHLEKGNYVIWLFPIKSQIQNLKKIDFIFTIRSTNEQTSRIIGEDRDYTFINTFAAKYFRKKHPNHFKSGDKMVLFDLNLIPGLHSFITTSTEEERKSRFSITLQKKNCYMIPEENNKKNLENMEIGLLPGGTLVLNGLNYLPEVSSMGFSFCGGEAHIDEKEICEFAF